VLNPHRSGRLRQVLAFALLASLGALALAIASSARLERADFTFNNGAEVQTLDPATVSGVPEGRVVRAIFEGLCVKDPRTLEPLPGMAESWELSEDRRTYTFKIREDALWTNGEPVTAHDFEYSWRRMLNPLTAAEYAYQLWYIRGAKQYTLMDDELEFLTAPHEPFWIQELETGRVRVGVAGTWLEPEAGEQLQIDVVEGAAYPSTQSICSYPFMFDEQGMWLPFDFEVTRINPKLEKEISLILKDPCGEQWLAELEVEPGALDALRAKGELLPGQRYRSEVYEEHLLGLRAEDEGTFVVELNEPTPYFLDICAFYPVFPVSRAGIEAAQARWPNEWQMKWLRPENLVTNGPYRIEFRRVNDRIRLRKNATYWDADDVAFDTVDILAIDHLGTSLNLYLMGELDWIDRPITNVIPRLLPREDFNPAAYLGSYFYRVNVTRPPFDDPRVRRALALAIDRQAICRSITKAGEQIAFGFAPPGMGSYPMVEMRHSSAGADYAENFARDVAEARELLVAAGFGPGAGDAGGRAFPTFEIHYNTDQTHKDIAEVIADDWKRHLGLNVKLLNQEWKVYLDAQKSLDFTVTRSAWIGDYPDPNTFLDMFVTGGENNRTGWGNPRYDELIAMAAMESDETARMAQFAEAEALLLEELPILPIYYYVTRNLVNPRLGGFHANVQDEHFSKFWYWMSDEELAAKRAAQPADWAEVPAHGPAAGLYAPAHGR
jgi:oligopeptide transport system substrate-binding protein